MYASYDVVQKKNNKEKCLCQVLGKVKTSYCCRTWGVKKNLFILEQTLKSHFERILKNLEECQETTSSILHTQKQIRCWKQFKLSFLNLTLNVSSLKQSQNVRSRSNKTLSENKTSFSATDNDTSKYIKTIFKITRLVSSAIFLLDVLSNVLSGTKVRTPSENIL